MFNKPYDKSRYIFTNTLKTTENTYKLIIDNNDDGSSSNQTKCQRFK